MLIHSTGVSTKKELLLKRQLENLIEKLGPLDPRTIRKSQQLDLVIIERQKHIAGKAWIV